MKFKKIPYILVFIILMIGLFMLNGCGMNGEPEYAIKSTGHVSADGMFNYDVYENRTAVITGGVANDICLTIPAMIDGYPVVEIGEGAFADNTSIGYLILGENVRKISFSAFNQCAGLIRVEATSALRTVGNSAFAGCTALCEFTGATKLETIGESAFFQCISLVAAPLPATLKTVEGQAFYGCSSLTEIILPEKMTVLKDSTFGFCDSLTRVELGNVATIEPNAFQRCTSLCKLTIGKTVTSVGESAFRGCYALSELEISGKVSEIGYCAFEETPWLEAQTDAFVIVGDGVLLRYNGTDSDVTIPVGVRIIADAFCDNDNIKSVTIPDSVIRIGSSAFGGCGQLSRVVVGNKVQTIADTAFAGCPLLASVYLPKSLTYIGNGAFSGCNLLSSISYAGSARDWAKITVEGSNAPLTLAELRTGQKY